MNHIILLETINWSPVLFFHSCEFWSYKILKPLTLELGDQSDLAIWTLDWISTSSVYSCWKQKYLGKLSFPETVLFYTSFLVCCLSTQPWVNFYFLFFFARTLIEWFCSVLQAVFGLAKSKGLEAEFCLIVLVVPGFDQSQVIPDLVSPDADIPLIQLELLFQSRVWVLPYDSIKLHGACRWHLSWETPSQREGKLRAWN